MCRGPNYMEVDIDVASSSVARHVVGLVSGASKSVVVDMGILLQVR
jgi:Protein ENHANCED DISEASE RESISTANCE 2, C-terminal